MEIQFQSNNGPANIDLSDKVFDAKYNEALVHQVVTAYLAGMRLGTKAQKTRSEVSGGGAKPWRQKGSGRARAGTIRSPIWRGGGVTFAAKPRDFRQKVNKKMYRAGLRSIFSELRRRERLYVISSYELTECKTKSFLQKAEQWGLGDDFLLIMSALDMNVYLSARNIPGVTVIDVASIDPVFLLKHDKVVVEEAALKEINEWLL